MATNFEPCKLSSRARLCLALMAHGLTQAEAARRVGLSTRHAERLRNCRLGSEFFDNELEQFIKEMRRCRIAAELRMDGLL